MIRYRLFKITIWSKKLMLFNSMVRATVLLSLALVCNEHHHCLQTNQPKNPISSMVKTVLSS